MLCFKLKWKIVNLLNFSSQVSQDIFYILTHVAKITASPTTFLDDSLSRDSGRSSYGEVTDDSPVLAEASARNLLPSRPWFDKQHFFNRPVDEYSEYSYSSPKEDEDSGVSRKTNL